MAPGRQEVYLKRRLNRGQIFFIALGGIIGIGFFQESSKALAITGPVGCLIAVVVVGVVAISVMECICELIILWPIPNAMVEFVTTFVDEDLGVAVGVMYWYTNCVTFSALIISATNLTNYWGSTQELKVLIYVLAPFGLILVNCCPVQVFGWIEFFGGIVKLCLVVGTIILMFVVNAGVNPEKDKIGARYFNNGITYNTEVASARYQAVFEAIPLATFAYIGIELLTTTAFEARDPEELRFPAATIGWFSAVLYTVATGAFVSNVSWQDRNLPELFQQALSVMTDPESPNLMKFQPPAPDTAAAPLIALYRVGWRFLPSFLNGCFIYSALSCANTALYVSSRQLYGLTRVARIGDRPSLTQRVRSWISAVHYKAQVPWLAVTISGVILFWLPFIRIRSDTTYLKDVQDALIDIGSVSCVLMWCAQCVAYIMFFQWRDYHTHEFDQLAPKWDKLFDRRNGGYFRDFQPFFGYLGAICTLVIIFFFNIVSLWNGERLAVKAVSAFVSPGIVLVIWLVKKFSRRDDRRFKFFHNWSNFAQFEGRLQRLDDLIYPGERPNASAEEVDMEMSAMSEQRQPLVFSGGGGYAGANPEERVRDRAVSASDFSARLAPRRATFNRANLTFAPSEPHMRHGYMAASPEPDFAEVVSPVARDHSDAEVELDASAYNRWSGIQTEAHNNREFLSPSSAGLRR